MRAGDNVIWKVNDSQQYICKIIAVFKIEDSINKKVIGKTLYRLDFNGHDFHVFGNEIQSIK